MKTAKFYGEIVDGVLTLDRHNLLNKYLENLPNQRIEITVAKESEDKTAEQLKYYFSCVVQPLADHLGYTKKEIDGVICKELLTVNPGTKKEYVKS